MRADPAKSLQLHFATCPALTRLRVVPAQEEHA